MRTDIVENIAQINPSDWNALAGDSFPFMRHEFLVALERHDCVGERYGWLPQHILVYDDKEQLVGAAPMYNKDNSYGELVFDWGWADAYHRNGLNYYPKLVIAIPYTPATGPRLLVAAQHPEPTAIRQAIIARALQIRQALDASSVHCLFTQPDDTTALHEQGFLLRIACQFHWHNQAYKNFDAFLAQLSHQKRKNIRRERRQVQDSEIRIEILHGNEISEAQWADFYRFYQSTYNRLGGYATLSLGFFQEIGKTMPRSVVLLLAYNGSRAVAGAFCLRDKQALYGRHWGCDEQHDGLHFETCYYQGIDYCIREGLQLFEPGAQGEHKLSRGFLPTRTWSAHWIEHPEFRQAIAQFLRQETAGINHYIQQLSEHSPFKSTTEQNC